MHVSKTMGVPAGEHPAEAKSASPDWESVRVFLEVVRRGSFRSASDGLGMSVNFIRGRVAKLEDHYKVPLLTRHVDGVRLTAEGHHILAAAKHMEEAAFGLSRASNQTMPAIAGEVKLAVTEGLGTFWVAPRLIEFQRTYPGLLVDLKCEMRSADVLRLEADASIQLERPQSADLKVMKIGRLHSMPFVSPEYVEIYGMPKGQDDIRKNHRIVLQVADQTRTRELYDQHGHGQDQVGFVAMRTNVSSAHVWAVAKGAGIGWLPTYVPAVGGGLIPLDIGIQFQFDIWLTYHPDAKRIPRVKRMIEWTIEAFDSRSYPWFRDEFVHPRDLPKEYRGQPLVNMFAGFTHTPDSAAPPAAPGNLAKAI
jgi:DNA-binding transcriptional LysR family regulator